MTALSSDCCYVCFIQSLIGHSYDDDNTVPTKPTQGVFDSVEEPADVASHLDQARQPVETFEQANMSGADVDDDNDIRITGDDSNSYNNGAASSGGMAGAAQYSYDNDEQPIGIKEDG